MTDKYVYVYSYRKNLHIITFSIGKTNAHLVHFKAAVQSTVKMYG